CRAFENLDMYLGSDDLDFVKKYPLFCSVGNDGAGGFTSSISGFLDGLHSINPNCNFRVIDDMGFTGSDIPDNEISRGYCIVIFGDSDRERDEVLSGLMETWSKVLFLTASGWRAYLSPSIQDMSSLGLNINQALNSRTSTIGGLLGSVLAINDAIKWALGVKSAHFIDKFTTFSLFDYTSSNLDPGPELPEILDFGRVAVAGTGAVGGIYISLLPLLWTPIKGTLNLIDFDKLEIHNLNRTLYARVNDVGQFKVDVARDFLMAVDELSDLEIRVERCKLEDSRVLNDDVVDIALALIDSVHGRRELQDKLPRSIIHSGTDGFFVDVFVSKNLLEGACLKCLFDAENPLWDDARAIAIKRLQAEKRTEKLLPGDVTDSMVEGIMNEILTWKISEEERLGRPIPMYKAVAHTAGIKIVQYPAINAELLKLQKVSIPVPTLPPISALPALSCLCETIKIRHFPKAVLNNRWQVNLLGKIDESLKLVYPRRAGCSCRDKNYQLLYKSIYGLMSRKG
ncbi:MAG: ThiF family adenylyltransferase, partial [Promethearchaeota archaeon]